MSIVPDSGYGRRVRDRLEHETLVWFTTVSADGTPQPNPVWFLWEPDTESILIYNATHAKRIGHVAVRPRVALNFEADEHGGDVVVLTGVAEQALDVPPATGHETYLAKYAAAIERIGSDREKFARDYSVPLRIRLTTVRGF
ncbi:MAG TPA: TIGR03667 family PPOX class F420-dependent oxidoreductase [Jatrophihabitans sp.]|jgi:PPOX class probable F420-dependent enzyme